MGRRSGIEPLLGESQSPVLTATPPTPFMVGGEGLEPRPCACKAPALPAAPTAHIDHSASRLRSVGHWDCLASPQGLEPRKAEPESAVLPFTLRRNEKSRRTSVSAKKRKSVTLPSSVTEAHPFL